MKHLFTLQFVVVSLLLSVTTYSQVTVTSSDSLSCLTPCTTLTAHLLGDEPIDAGITIDDQYPTAYNPIGFTFDFYGIPYTQCIIGPNGTICFNPGLEGSFETWIATGPLLGQVPVENSICGPWCDIDIEYGGTITYSTTGIAPNRKFIITFCHVAMFSCTTQYINTQMILYETTNIIEVHVGHKDICPSWYGAIPGLALLGVQNAAGTEATVAPGHDYPSVYTCTDEGWRFSPITLPSGAASYTVAAIPYAPEPYALSTIYWFNATTGAYIDTGNTLVVCPTTVTTYKAGALGCNTADTSFGYYTVTPGDGPLPIFSFTNPSICTACNGTITMTGLAPGLIDTIHYMLGGVAQPPIVVTAPPSGTVVMSGLCSGIYSNIIVTQAGCVSAPGGATLSIASVSFTVSETNPTVCGECDGSVTLTGLTPGLSDTINYMYDGTPQPHIVTTIPPGGSITITGLCAGTYSNITVTQGTCTSAPAAPFALINPAVTFTVSHINPTVCGICNGSITLSGLTPGLSDTINYMLGGVPQPEVIATVAPGGTIVMTGLCPGIYSNITVTQGLCTSAPASPVTLTVPIVSFSITHINPSICGACDGSITLTGLTPGLSDTVNYLLGGVPQPEIVAIVSTGGTITITGLCAGTYSNIIVTQGTCTSAPVGPVVLVNPAISFTETQTNPSHCDGSDGTITLSGLHASTAYTITYNYNSVPQPPIAATSSTGGTITLSGLSAGVYANVIVTFGACSSSPEGPYTLVNPGISFGIITTVNPTTCNGSDGALILNGLYPAQTYTLTYTYNGTAQPPLTVTANGGGTITLTGLSAGVYDTIIASFGPCITPQAGPYTLTNPAIAISGVTLTSPTSCGACDGTMTLNGLYPSHAFTITYNYNGVPQAPVATTSSATGSITITGLCAGSGSAVYDNIVASFGPCTTPPAGPYTMSGPPPPVIYMTAFTSPTQCGYCDGSITIHSIAPYISDTIFYKLNGVVQPSFLNIALPDGTIYIPGLCAGDYDSFTVMVGPCPSTVEGAAILTNPTILDSFKYVNHFGCNGDTVMFTNRSSASGPLFYIWNFGDSVTDTATNPMHIYAQGIYTITLTADDHFCDTTFTLSDSLEHPLLASFVDTPFIYCQGSPVTLTNTTVAPAGAAFTYEWLFGDGSTDTATNMVHVYPKAGVYTVQLVATNFVPCSDTASLSVYVDSSSAISLTVTDSVLCESSSVTFTGTYSKIGYTGITWNFGDGDSTTNMNPITHSFDGVGTYTVTATAHYRRCDDTSVSKQFTIFPGPSIYLGPDTSICIGSEALTLIDVQNATNKDATWVWNTGQTTPGITVVEPGFYSATVDINGCYATDTVWVTNDCYVNIPNVFTPNGDGLNDYFYPLQTLAKGLVSFKMDIYNRWGQLLFEATGLDGRGWDGKFNGADQPEDVYIYVMDAVFQDGQKQHHKGNVTLLR